MSVSIRARDIVNETPSAQQEPPPPHAVPGSHWAVEVHAAPRDGLHALLLHPLACLFAGPS